MTLLLVDPPEFAVPQKNDVDRLIARIDNFVSTLDDVFPEDMIGRALLAKGADVAMKANGVFAARWAISRTLDLITGRWVPEIIHSFIESYQK